MQIKIDDVLNENGKSRYWLAKEIGVTYPTMLNLCNNNTTSIKFEIMEKICKVLNCKPNDIFKIDE